MHSEMTKAYSDILERIKDVEYHYKELKNDDITIEEIHVIRDSNGKPISLKVATCYNRGY